MLCKYCRVKPVVRGVKTIKCFKCGIDAIVNYAYSNTCYDCSNTLVICQCCGKEIKPE